MATWLKQSTAVDVKVGPFLDDTDGKTAETALTITQPDILLGKNGGAFAQKNAAQTLSHESNGWYEVALDATDTNTLGILVLQIHETGALPVWREFMVVPADVYDAIISGTGNGVRASVQAIASGAVDSVWAKALSDLTAVPGATASVVEALNWLFMLARNQIEQTSSTMTVRKDNSSTAVATAAVSDNGTTYQRNKFS